MPNLRFAPVPGIRSRAGAVCSLLLLLFVFQSFAFAEAPLVRQWTVFQANFTSKSHYENPPQEEDLAVEFTAPSGKVTVVNAFWDGGDIWRVRFSPDETGRWSYLTKSSADDPGLDHQSGTFTCAPYNGTNPLYRHGVVRVSSNRRFLEQADGTPFLWLSDTAWNGVLKSQLADWNTYLSDRRSKEFSVIQFVMTQWIASSGNGEGRLAYQDWKRIRIDPTFFQWIDERIQAVNQHGLVAAPVMLWSAPWSKFSKYENPGNSLDESQLAKLASYMVARYGAYQVIWILSGDGSYHGAEADMWNRIARTAFGDHPSRLVTTHPAGHLWMGEEFGNESWYSFYGYQSGYGDQPKDLEWHTHGPPATEWKHEPVHPVVDLEANYEGHLSSEGQPFNARSVRRSGYWALMVSPTAGFTYGAHGIWSWEVRPAVPMNHLNTGVARPWYEAIKYPGSMDMKHMKDFFYSVQWWTLVPAPELVVDQPGDAKAVEFMPLSRSTTSHFALLYMPTGQKARIKASDIAKGAIVRWFNPRTGAWLNPQSISADGSITAPDSEDWAAWIGAKDSKPAAQIAGENK